MLQRISPLCHPRLLLVLLGLAVIIWLPPSQTGAAPLGEATAPALGLSLASALANQTVTLTGTYFSTSGTASISSITMGGTAVAADKISSGSLVVVDSAGKFFATLMIPVTAPYLAPGAQTVLVTDSDGKTASATLTIPQPTLSLVPVTSRAGTTVTVTGTNYPKYSTRLGSDAPPQVRIDYRLPDLKVKRVVTATPDSSGNISVSFVVPRDAPAGSKDNLVTATIAGTPTKVEAKHSVDEVVLSLSPASGAPEAEITVSGSKLRPYTAVGSLTMGNLKMRTTANVYTDADGSFAATFVVPLLEDGLYGVTAEVGDVRYSAAFTVVGSGVSKAEPPPVPAEPSRSIALVGALRPLGDTLVRVFHFDRELRKWSFYDPRPIFAKNVDLLELVEGEIYWVEVVSGQQVVLDGEMRTFYRGWNLISW